MRGLWGSCPVVGENLHWNAGDELPQGWKHCGCTLKKVPDGRLVNAGDAYKRMAEAAADRTVSLADVKKILDGMPAAEGYQHIK